MNDELHQQLVQLLARVEEEQARQANKEHYSNELGWQEVSDAHHSMRIALGQLEDAVRVTLTVATQLAEVAPA